MAAAAVLHHVRFNPPALRDARDRARLSLIAAGERVGRDASVLARYEKGQLTPPATLLGLLAAAYNVQVGDFYTGGDR